MRQDEMGQFLCVSQQHGHQMEENDAGRIRVENRSRQRCQQGEKRQNAEAYHESDWEGHQGNEEFNKMPCSSHGPLQQGGPIDEAVVNVLDEFEERQFELIDVEKEEEAEGHP